ncbi:MAG: hypothetical protein PVH48_02500 [Cyclobacteriaceae bacterium]
MKRILLILFIIFGCLVSIKARDRKEIKGVLITASCDTLHGYLKKTSEKRQFETIQFRKMSEFEYEEYCPLFIEAFISDEFSLISHKIKINNVDQYIFIKKIYDGTMNLYFSRLDLNSDLINDYYDLFFVEIEEGLVIQLHKQFLIRTLMAIFNDSDCALAEIDTEKFDYYYYKDSKLIDLFTTYDSCQPPGLVIKPDPKKTKTLRP